MTPQHAKIYNNRHTSVGEMWEMVRSFERGSGTQNSGYARDERGTQHRGDTAAKGECSGEQAEAYLYAVEVLRDALLGLQCAGIDPNEQCDALGYTLIKLMSDHYPEEIALLLFETLQSTLKECYKPGLAPFPDGLRSAS